MKMKKSDFKNIVKECLVEILSEGLVANSSGQKIQSISTIPKQTTIIKNNQQSQQQIQKNKLDTINSLLKQRQNTSVSVNNSQNTIPSKISSNKMLKEIFEDTAKNSTKNILPEHDLESEFTRIKKETQLAAMQAYETKTQKSSNSAINNKTNQQQKALIEQNINLDSITAEQVVEQLSPEQIFGSEISDKWAKLAFEPTQKES